MKTAAIVSLLTAWQRKRIDCPCKKIDCPCKRFASVAATGHLVPYISVFRRWVYLFVRDKLQDGWTNLNQTFCGDSDYTRIEFRPKRFRLQSKRSEKSSFPVRSAIRSPPLSFTVQGCFFFCCCWENQKQVWDLDIADFRFSKKTLNNSFRLGPYIFRPKTFPRIIHVMRRNGKRLVTLRSVLTILTWVGLYAGLGPTSSHGN